MISFKAFLSEGPSILYRRVDDKVADALRDGKTLPISRKFMSFVQDKKHLKSEFGNRTLMCKVSDLPKGCKVIPVQYDFEWFTRTTLNKEILEMVTGRTQEDWEEEFDSVDDIDNELESLYEDEHEIVVIGLKEFSPKIFKEIK